jgi:hypothetical protein
MKGLAFLLFFLPFLFHTPAEAQEGMPVATVMFYNLENYYDTEDDTLKKDNEFLPQGDKRWTKRRFWDKVDHISRVIINTGNWEPPAVIGVCEVENRKVLEILTASGQLKNWKYEVIHKDSPDERGIDVAALYRPDLFMPLTYRYFPPVAEGEPIPYTREILYIYGVMAGADTIHLFYNHWPSRYSGLMETRSHRSRAGQRLRNEVINLSKKHLHPKIIIMGDFNDQPEDESLATSLGAGKDLTGNPEHMVNLSTSWINKNQGTLKFRSQWNIFDQIIVTESLLSKTSRLYCLPEDARILALPFLLEPDEQYTGMKLNRTYSGFQYMGGYSDHLPVLLMLRKN